MNIREGQRWLFSIVLLYCYLVVVGCANKSEKFVNECEEGQSILDGICVRQEIVDYVGCVRAQGVQTKSINNKSISAGVGYFAIEARAVEDVSKNLEKTYAASDKAMLAIIKQCNKIAGIHEHSFPQKKRKLHIRENPKKYLSENKTDPSNLVGRWSSDQYCSNGSTASMESKIFWKHDGFVSIVTDSGCPKTPVGIIDWRNGNYVDAQTLRVEKAWYYGSRFAYPTWVSVEICLLTKTTLMAKFGKGRFRIYTRIE